MAAAKNLRATTTTAAATTAEAVQTAGAGAAARGRSTSPRRSGWTTRHRLPGGTRGSAWDPRSNPRTGYSPGGYTLRFLTDGVGSSWAKAVAINGQSPCGAAVTAAAKLLLWHWLQPAL